MQQVWNLQPDEVKIETLRTKWEEFFKPQINELRSWYNFIKFFFHKLVQVLINGTIKHIPNLLALCNYPPQTSNILSKYILVWYARPETSCEVHSGHQRMESCPDLKKGQQS